MFSARDFSQLRPQSYRNKFPRQQRQQIRLLPLFHAPSAASAVLSLSSSAAEQNQYDHHDNTILTASMHWSCLYTIPFPIDQINENINDNDNNTKQNKNTEFLSSSSISSISVESIKSAIKQFNNSLYIPLHLKCLILLEYILLLSFGLLWLISFIYAVGNSSIPILTILAACLFGLIISFVKGLRISAARLLRIQLELSMKNINDENNKNNLYTITTIPSLSSINSMNNSNNNNNNNNNSINNPTKRYEWILLPEDSLFNSDSTLNIHRRPIGEYRIGIQIFNYYPYDRNYNENKENERNQQRNDIGSNTDAGTDTGTSSTEEEIIGNIGTGIEIESMKLFNKDNNNIDNRGNIEKDEFNDNSSPQSDHYRLEIATSTTTKPVGWKEEKHSKK